jgi:hypothetical protein
VPEALYRVSREAARLWQTAPSFIARESVVQRALVHKKNRLSIGVGMGSIGSGIPLFQTREILSYYSLGAFQGAPEALHEFRETFSVDGHSVAEEPAARAKLIEELEGDVDATKQELVKQFEKKCVAGAATDFGQLILLFTRSHVDKYSYEVTGDGRIGADTAWVLSFKQLGGEQALRITDNGKKIVEKLQGEIWVRQGDYLPLRITLNSTRARDKSEIRDEAKVDYTVVSGALLPASLTYRRFTDDDLALESVYRYSNWEALPGK